MQVRAFARYIPLSQIYQTELKSNKANTSDT